jgi:50S ribosomal subunit-associated GTPase HflX
VPVSARTGEGIDALLETLSTRLSLDTERVVLEFDAAEPRDRELMASVYRVARVLSHRTEGTRTALEVSVPKRWLPRLAAAAARS